MDARQWNGGPDDGTRFDTRPAPREPRERQCYVCQRWTEREIDVAKIWWFCSINCREAFLAPKHDVERECMASDGEGRR